MDAGKYIEKTTDLNYFQVTMQTIKSEIIEYSSNVVNEIDVQCEKVLEKLNDKNEIEKTRQINDIRKMMIEKVHEIERLNLNDLSIETKCAFEKKFFFFIPNNEMKIVPLNNKDIETKMLLNNEVGLFIILSQTEQRNFISSFKYDIKKPNENAKETSYRTFEDFAKFKIITTLMKKRLALEQNTYIYDLSNQIENIIETLEINAYGLKDVTEIDLNWLTKLINIELLESLEIELSKIDRIKTGNFSILKNLNDLTLRCRYVEKFEQKSFLGLNNLRLLTLFGIKGTEENFFESLFNLNSLVFWDCNFSECKSYFFKGLHKLKYLTFLDTKFSCLKKDTFIHLNNLECLSIVSCEVNHLDEDCLSGLDNLIQLHIDAHNSFNYDEGFKIHINAFKSCQNLEIVNFDRCKLTDSDIISIHNLKKLKYLVLADNLISQIEFLNNFQNLEVLDIFNIKFDQDQFDRLTISNLKYFKFSSDKIPIFKENFRNLQAIDGMISLWGEDIANRLKNLERLDCLKLRINSFEMNPNETFQFIENLKIFDLIFASDFFSNESKEAHKNFIKILESLYFSQEKTEKYHFKELSIYRAIFETISPKEYFDNVIDVSPSVRKELKRN